MNSILFLHFSQKTIVEKKGNRIRVYTPDEQTKEQTSVTFQDTMEIRSVFYRMKRAVGGLDNFYKEEKLWLKS
jgi:hypothetical protein